MVSVITVRDYASPDRPIRDYRTATDRWPLAVRRNTRLAADAGPTAIELDLLVKLEGGQMIGVVPRRSAVEELGLRPLMSIELRTGDDPLEVLSLLVAGSGAEITLEAGTIVADLVVLRSESVRLIPDPDLDFDLRPNDAGVLSHLGSDDEPDEPDFR